MLDIESTKLPLDASGLVAKESASSTSSLRDLPQWRSTETSFSGLQRWLETPNHHLLFERPWLLAWHLGGGALARVVAARLREDAIASVILDS